MLVVGRLWSTPPKDCEPGLLLEEGNLPNWVTIIPAHVAYSSLQNRTPKFLKRCSPVCEDTKCKTVKFMLITLEAASMLGKELGKKQPGPSE